MSGVQTNFVASRDANMMLFSMDVFVYAIRFLEEICPGQRPLEQLIADIRPGQRSFDRVSFCVSWMPGLTTERCRDFFVLQVHIYTVRKCCRVSLYSTDAIELPTDVVICLSLSYVGLLPPHGPVCLFILVSSEL